MRRHLLAESLSAISVTGTLSPPFPTMGDLEVVHQLAKGFGLRCHLFGRALRQPGRLHLARRALGGRVLGHHRVLGIRDPARVQRVHGVRMAELWRVLRIPVGPVRGLHGLHPVHGLRLRLVLVGSMRRHVRRVLPALDDDHLPGSGRLLLVHLRLVLRLLRLSLLEGSPTQQPLQRWPRVSPQRLA